MGWLRAFGRFRGLRRFQTRCRFRCAEWPGLLWGVAWFPILGRFWCGGRFGCGGRVALTDRFGPPEPLRRADRLRRLGLAGRLWRAVIAVLAFDNDGARARELVAELGHRSPDPGKVPR